MFKLSEITWQTKLVAFLSACAICFSFGWRAHGWKTDAGVTHAIAKVEKTRQSDEVAQGGIVNVKQEKQDKVKAVYETIREKVYVQDDRSVCFTAESLQLWNAAIGANTDLHRRKSPGGTEVAEATQAEQEKSTGTSNQSGEDPVATDRDVLMNAADNFEICTDNSVKHLALIDRVRSLQGRMCYCSK